jgi:aryl-alcohol dehydrogenase-like predicted oxidoreductase
MLVRTRAFGKTALKVSELGLGCARIGGIFQADTRGFLDLLWAARDAGINFFDTADMYSQGESEALIGRAFKGQRDRVVIASKAGYCLPARRKLAARLKPLLRPAIRLLKIRRERLPASARGSVVQDFSADYLRKAVEGSLRRLQTDYLDLFQLHSPPVDVVERGEWEAALEALKRAGKVRYYGVSCDTVEAGLAAMKYASVSSLQLTLSLLEQRNANDVMPVARERGVAVVARECLGNGLLAKRAEEIDLGTYCQTAQERELRQQQLVKYRQLAAERGCSLARLALDYVTGTDGVSVALVGARTRDQLRNVLGDLAYGPSASALA